MTKTLLIAGALAAGLAATALTLAPANAKTDASRNFTASTKAVKAPERTLAQRGSRYCVGMIYFCNRSCTGRRDYQLCLDVCMLRAGC